MMSEELKPCPFCGEAGTSTDVQTGTPDREGVPTNLMCGKCGACGPWDYEPEGYTQKAIAAWNSRAGEGKYRELVEAAKDAEDVLFAVVKLAIPLADGDNHALPESVINRARAALTALKEGRE